MDADAAAIRLFANSGMAMLLAQSYSKNLGLYGERTGCISVVCKDKNESMRVESQLKAVIRPMYSNPPRHGAAIVSTVLGSPELFSQWKVLAHACLLDQWLTLLLIPIWSARSLFSLVSFKQ